ncbi:unnamed protein product [Lota lota]
MYSSPSNASHGSELPPHSEFRLRPKIRRQAMDHHSGGERRSVCRRNGRRKQRAIAASLRSTCGGVGRDTPSLGKLKTLSHSHRSAGANDGLYSTASADPGSVHSPRVLTWRPFSVGSPASTHGTHPPNQSYSETARRAIPQLPHPSLRLNSYLEGDQGPTSHGPTPPVCVGPARSTLMGFKQRCLA